MGVGKDGLQQGEKGGKVCYGLVLRGSRKYPKEGTIDSERPTDGQLGAKGV